MQNSRVGILGGGQLSRMLAEASHRLGLETHALTEKPNDPVAHTPTRLHIGKVENSEVMGQFLKSIDVVTFENEFIDVNLVRRRAVSLPIRFSPSLEVIELLQDKLKQKQTLEKLQVPTAEFRIAPASASTISWLETIQQHFNGEFVLKWSRMGYDGKGVWISRPGTRLDDAAVFVDQAHESGHAVYAEKKIRFKHELAIVAVRSPSAKFVAFPLVISKQTDGICHWVYGPATSLGVSDRLQKEAEDYLRRLADSVQIEGAFAVEFFLDQEDKLIVNEIAPRVHNTGHYSQHAASHSQFENHWRALLDFPLAPVQTKNFFAMLNLVGPDSIGPMENDRRYLPEPPARTSLYWYDKPEIRARRKLGHLNGWAESSEELQDLLEKMASFEETWHKNLKAEDASGS